MRLVETRLLEGPNVYRLEPVVKLEVAVGRRRTWYGQRDPGRHALVQLGADVPAREWPDPVAATVAWIRRLRTDHGEGRGGARGPSLVRPGHWIVTFPWVGAERALTLTEAALALAERDVSPSRTAQLTGAQERLLARWTERIATARHDAARWIRDADRRDADRVDLRHERQEHGDAADHAHPAAAPGGASGRRRRTASWSTSGWSSRATGRARAARSRSSPGATSTSPSSRPRAAGSSCAASATSRTTRAS